MVERKGNRGGFASSVQYTCVHPCRVRCTHQSIPGSCVARSVPVWWREGAIEEALPLLYSAPQAVSTLADSDARISQYQAVAWARVDQCKRPRAKFSATHRHQQTQIAKFKATCRGQCIPGGGHMRSLMRVWGQQAKERCISWRQPSTEVGVKHTSEGSI
eukprot:1142640-Pelagomonas_calceolata.AAC.11